MRLRSACSLTALTALTALTLVAPSVLPVAWAAPAPQAVFVLDGRGHGHGVGMAQDSANAMAAAGAGHEQILNLFYPGTGRAVRSSPIRVAVWEAEAPTGSVTVTVPRGAQVGNDSRSVHARPGALLQVSVDGAGYHVRELTAPARGAAVRAGLLASPSPSPSRTGGPLPGIFPSSSPAPAPTTAPNSSPSPRPSSSGQPAPQPQSPAPGTSSSPAAQPAPSSAPSGQAGLAFDSASPVTLAPSAGGTATVAATGRTYRGRLIALSRQGFRLVNALDIEDYLRGLGEVPAGWLMAALRTQAVAARTYALRAVGAGQPLGYDVCDDTRCQVYLGVGAESPRTAAAARETRGEVVTYGGGLADTFYSANAGGLTATPGEGFGGSTTIPYLPGGTRAPGGVDPWKLTVSPQDVAGRLGYGGRLDAIVIVAKGPSGRVTRVRLDGSAGPVELTGIQTQRRLGLLSTLFTVSRSTGTAQALPAAAAATTQIAPTQAAMIAGLPSPAASPPPGEQAGKAAASSPEDLPAWAVATAGVLLVLAVFAVVLSRRAHLVRVRGAS